MAPALAHIPEGHLHATVFESYCNSYSQGPIKIEYCVDLSIPQVSVAVYLVSVRIGGGTIDPSHPSITIGGGVAGFKAEVTLTADFGAKHLKYKIDLCAPLVGCKTYNGTLFSW